MGTAGCTVRVGGVAQLGERVSGIHEVRGSIPLASTDAGRDEYGRLAQLVRAPR